MKKILLAGVVVLLSACKAPATDESVPLAPLAETARSATTEELPSLAESAGTVPAFVDKVWKVSASSAVEVGTTYTFLSSGQLVIDSPNGTPLHGMWVYEKDMLSIMEEGQNYAADVVKLDANTFEIRIHTPGENTDITLVPAPEVALPATK